MPQIDRAAIIAKIKAAIADAGAADADADANPADANPKIPDTAVSESAPSSMLDAVGRAKRMIWQLKALGFTAYLDDHGALPGALLIADVTGRRRDVSWHLPIARVFGDLNAGLDEDPRLLDSMTKVTGLVEPCQS